MASNVSRMATVVCVPLTSNLSLGGCTRERASPLTGHWTAEGPGGERLQTVAVDRSLLSERAGRATRALLEEVLAGIDVVHGR